MEQVNRIAISTTQDLHLFESQQSAFPYFPWNTFRNNQLTLMEKITEGISKRQNTVIRTSAFSGKKIACISAVLPYIFTHQKKVWFVVFSDEDGKQVLDEINAIYESENILKAEEQLQVMSLAKDYFDDEIFPNIVELTTLIEESNFIVIHFSALCLLMGCREPEILSLPAMEENIFIFDECHFLPEQAREEGSIYLSNHLLESIMINISEMEKSSHISALNIVIRKLLDFQKDFPFFVPKSGNLLQNHEKPKNEEYEYERAFMPREIMETIFSEFDSSSSEFSKGILLPLISWCTNFSDKKNFELKKSIYYVLQFVQRLNYLLTSPTQIFYCGCKLIPDQKPEIVLSIRLLDPKKITNEIFAHSFATISLSTVVDTQWYYTLLGLNQWGGKKPFQLCPQFPEQVSDLFSIEVDPSIRCHNERFKSVVVIQIQKRILEICNQNRAPINIYIGSSLLFEHILSDSYLDQLKLLKRGIGIYDYKNSTLNIIKKDSRNHEKTMQVNFFPVKKVTKIWQEIIKYPATVNIVVGVPFSPLNVYQKKLTSYYEKKLGNYTSIFLHVIPTISKINFLINIARTQKMEKFRVLFLDSQIVDYQKYLLPWIYDKIHYINS